jgi:hypothetical protein
MPKGLSETGKLARKYGITYACARHRLKAGIPLDAPPMRGNPAKAWDSRGRTVIDYELEYGLSRNTIKYRLQHGIPMETPVMSKEQTLALANKKRLEMIAAGTLKKRKYRTNPDSLERNMELRVKPTQPRNPWARP